MNHRSIVLPLGINDSQSEEKVGQPGQFREQYTPVIIIYYQLTYPYYFDLFAVKVFIKKVFLHFFD